MWGALSNERTGLLFTLTAGPRQRSHSRVRVPLDLRSHFTASNSRLPFSSPPTTRRATVEVFDPASTRDFLEFTNPLPFITSTRPGYKSLCLRISSVATKPVSNSGQRFDCSKRVRCRETCFNNPLTSNGLFCHNIILRLQLDLSRGLVSSDILHPTSVPRYLARLILPNFFTVIYTLDRAVGMQQTFQHKNSPNVPIQNAKKTS
jgi:hypothetical protein